MANASLVSACILFTSVNFLPFAAFWNSFFEPKVLLKFCVANKISRETLSEESFKIKLVHSINKWFRVPRPLFNVQLEWEPKKLRKLSEGETHVIYNFQYLLHRSSTIEEKGLYTILIIILNIRNHIVHFQVSACVICGDLHPCPLDKEGHHHHHERRNNRYPV